MNHRRVGDNSIECLWFLVTILLSWRLCFQVDFLLVKHIASQKQTQPNFGKRISELGKGWIGDFLTILSRETPQLSEIMHYYCFLQLKSELNWKVWKCVGGVGGCSGNVYMHTHRSRYQWIYSTSMQCNGNACNVYAGATHAIQCMHCTVCTHVCGCIVVCVRVCSSDLCVYRVCRINHVNPEILKHNSIHSFLPIYLWHELHRKAATTFLRKWIFWLLF